jgi:hypothetical protein
MMACPYQHYHVCTALRQTLSPPLQNPLSEPLSSIPTLLLPPPMILPIRKTVRFRLRIQIVFRIPLPALQPLLQKLRSRAKPSESSTPDQFHRSPLNKSATSQTPSTVPLPTPPTPPSAYQEPPPPMSKSVTTRHLFHSFSINDSHSRYRTDDSYYDSPLYDYV